MGTRVQANKVRNGPQRAGSKAGMEAIRAIIASAKAHVVSLVPSFNHLNFNESGFESTPRKPGVYLIFKPDGKVMYVGMALILRDRIRQHANWGRKNQPLTGKCDLTGYMYSFYECNDRWWVEKFLQSIFQTNG